MADIRSAQLHSAFWIRPFSERLARAAYLTATLLAEIVKSGSIGLPTPLHEAKADLFRTLAHPVRIRVLELLSEREHAVHELLAKIELEPSALSQQLAVLRRAGIVRQRRDGGEVRYSLLVPSTRELLATARVTLSDLLADQARLRTELDEEVQAGRRG